MSTISHWPQWRRTKTWASLTFVRPLLTGTSSLCSPETGLTLFQTAFSSLDPDPDPDPVPVLVLQGAFIFFSFSPLVTRSFRVARVLRDVVEGQTLRHPVSHPLLRGRFSQTPAFDRGPGHGCRSSRRWVRMSDSVLSLRRDSGDLTNVWLSFQVSLSLRACRSAVAAHNTHTTHCIGPPSFKDASRRWSLLNNWCRSGREIREVRATSVRSDRVRVNGCTLWKTMGTMQARPTETGVCPCRKQRSSDEKDVLEK